MARREHKPLFIHDGVGHGEAAQRLEQTTFADREVRELLAHHFIAVWVYRLPDGLDRGTLLTITSSTTEYARFDTFTARSISMASNGEIRILRSPLQVPSTIHRSRSRRFAYACIE